MLRRAEDLGNCFVSDTQCKQSRRPVRFQNINRQLFETVFADESIDNGEDDDVHELATIVSNELHSCAVLSGCDENDKISKNYSGKWESVS